MVEFIAVISLGTVVIAQAIIQTIERQKFTKMMLDELSKAQKAVMSRNINEYIAAVQQDKAIPRGVQEEPDEVPLDNLPDDEFFNLVKKHTK